MKVFDVNMSGIFKILKFDKKCFILNLKFELVLEYKILIKNGLLFIPFLLRLRYLDEEQERAASTDRSVLCRT